MITRIGQQYGDDTCASCVVAGDFIFLAHHAGGQDQKEIVHQVHATLRAMQQTLEGVSASLADVVQLNFYIKDTEDFRKGADVFREYFPDGPPARMTVVTEFLSENCLCQMDAIAYKPAGFCGKK